MTPEKKQMQASKLAVTLFLMGMKSLNIATVMSTQECVSTKIILDLKNENLD